MCIFCNGKICFGSLRERSDYPLFLFFVCFRYLIFVLQLFVSVTELHGGGRSSFWSDVW